VQVNVVNSTADCFNHASPSASVFSALQLLALAAVALVAAR
jgi:hypothetical protein